MQLNTDINTIKANIDKVNTAGAALDDLIHQTACDCLYHAEQHGDVTLASRLIHAMPKSSRSKALKHWFTTYGPLNWNKSDECFQMAKGKKVKAFEVEAASEHPFYDLTKEREPLPFNVEQLIGYISRKVENGKEKGEVTEEAIAKLKVAVNGMAA